MGDIAKTWNHAWAVICNLSISWIKPKKHPYREECWRKQQKKRLDAAHTEKLWGALETSFGAVDTACLEKNYMHQNLIPPQAHLVQGQSIMSTYRFLGVCMVKIERWRQQLPIHGLWRGLILQPRRSWIQRSRQNGLQRRNGDYTMSARFPVKNEFLIY